MSTNTDKEDEQWLNALAGNADPASDPKINQQAESLRRALKASSNILTNQVPIADDAQYQQILFRLRREGLTSSNHAWRNPKLWGLAATVVIGVGVVIQMSVFNPDGYEKDIMRGSEHATVLLVTDPEARLSELQAGLQVAGEIPKIERLENKQIVLTVRATDNVLTFLRTQRIEPEIFNGQLIIKLKPSKSRN